MSDNKKYSIDQTVDAVTQASIETSRIDDDLKETAMASPERGETPSRSLPNVGDKLGRYTIKQLLGKGGMGAVFLAHDPTLDRKVAVKIPFLNASNADEVLHRFKREARAVAALQHPNICPVYEVTEDRGIHFMVMAFIEGRSLSDYLKKAKRFKVTSAINLVRKLALTLDEAHRKGVIHRDLKPANIMIDARNEPQIMDFGLARLDNIEASQLTAMGQILGTPAYMPPEQVGGDIDATGPSSDIYSLGVMLYEMLTGRLPLNGDLMSLMFKIANETPAPASTHREGIPEWLDKVCTIAMAKKPEQRFASMKAFADALQGEVATRVFESTLPIGAVAASAVPAVSMPTFTVGREAKRSPQVATRSGNGRYRSRILWIAAGAALPFALLAGGWIIKITNPDGTEQKIDVQAGAKIEITPPKLEEHPRNNMEKPALATLPTTPNAQPSRNAAIELLKQNGTFSFTAGEATQFVDDVKNLPPGNFKIISVSLDGNRSNDQVIAMLAELDSVTHFYYGGGDKPLGVQAFENLGRVKTLQDIFFNGGSIVDDARFQALGELPNLKHLVLWYNNITDHGLKQLERFPNISRIQIDGGGFTGSGLKALSPMLTVEGLAMGMSHFSDANISFLDRFPNLSSLALRDCKITSKGIKNLPRLTSLTTLELSYNQSITDVCLPEFKRFPLLEILMLNSTGITDRGLQELSTFKNLRQLDIENCSVSAEAVDRLQDALPNCKVVTNAPPSGGWPEGLRFDGVDDFVRTNLKCDGTTPITIEFIAMPLVAGNAVVGNWQYNGVGIDIFEDHWAFSYDTNEFRRATSEKRAICRRLYRVAGVFDGKDITLFIDGKVQARTPVVGHKQSSFSFMIGADSDDAGNPKYHFNGIIESVRISDVARYTEDYQATAKYTADDSTLLMLDFTRPESDLAKDMSKYDVLCEIVGATPVIGH